MKLKVLSAAFVCSALFGCGSESESGNDVSGLGLVTPGKADNYYSDVSAEFEMRGTISVSLTDEQKEDARLTEEAIKERLTAVGLYLTAYLTDKFEGIDINRDGEISDDEVFFRNVNYGGFQAMVRNYTVASELISEEADGSLSVEFTIDVGGPNNFLQQLVDNGARDTTDGVAFDLAMPAGATSNFDDVARREIRNFDPEAHEGEVETIELATIQHPEIADAYPHYAAFMEDGVYDITMVFGHDYNTPRADLEESRESYDFLLSRGFDAPVDTYDALDAESGPFVKTVTFRGEEVRIEVRLFHGDMFIDDRDTHKSLVIEELQKRDVFFYNGHAGPYYGLYLDADHEADVGYLEIADLELPEKQQLFVAQGCQTYSQYADMLYANPAKNENNLDAITTVNYSYGIGTLPLLEQLTAEQDGVFSPVTYREIVSKLNSHYWNYAKDVFYGVIGMDGNDQIHPQAELSTVGTACDTHDQCGTTTDANLCLGTSTGSICVARTLGDTCPSGMSHAFVAWDDQMIGNICYIN